MKVSLTSRKTLFSVLYGFLFGAIILLAGCDSGVNESIEPVEVRYEVTGSPQQVVVNFFQDGRLRMWNGEIPRIDNIAGPLFLPWTYSFIAEKKQILWLHVTSVDYLKCSNAECDISMRIFVDGELHTQLNSWEAVQGVADTTPQRCSSSTWCSPSFWLSTWVPAEQVQISYRIQYWESPGRIRYLTPTGWETFEHNDPGQTGYSYSKAFWAPPGFNAAMTLEIDSLSNRNLGPFLSDCIEAMITTNADVDFQYDILSMVSTRHCKAGDLTLTHIAPVY